MLATAIGDGKVRAFRGHSVHVPVQAVGCVGCTFCAAKRIMKEYDIILMSYMCMHDEMRAKREEIYAIARRHKAEKLWVFGSCARKEERPDSDVDFLVKFDGDIGLVEYVHFERELSDLLGRKVELTVNSALLREPRFAERVCREAVAI